MTKDQGLMTKDPVVVVDANIGNLYSVCHALEAIGAEAEVTQDPERILNATRLILPGVGAFGAAMEQMERLKLVEPVVEAARKGTPLLGICLGYQMLFEESEESPGVKGLGLLPGKVVRFHGPEKVPHMGWNGVRFPKPSRLFAGIAEDTYFYFVHSFFPEPARQEDICAITEYGRPFAAAVEVGSIAGVQFHPEKSQGAGVRLLGNFLD